MSTDSTELTFVRCPSCRSLVPASQTRCRMCGASLDASGKAEEGDKGDAKAARVKQRTMSQPKSEVAKALTQVRDEQAPAQSNAATELATVEEPAVLESKGLPADDPLGPYIEEQADADIEEEHDFEDSFDDLETEESNAQNGTAMQHKEQHLEEPVAAAPPPPAPEPVLNKARVTAEQGRRPSSSGLNFAKPKEDKQPSPAAREPQRASTPASFSTVGVQGRLCGWLVSYKNPEGSAIELREGKFFISSSSLKPSDLVINDPTVSTPHALVSVGGANGLQVQDLMSERGVFLRKRDADSYQKEDTMRLNNGDWVRFGDVEFLVSLIAHVGMK